SGRAGCDTAFHELGARAIADAGFAYRRRAVVDAYCLQHPGYLKSLKSFAAHLCGLCAAVERRDDPRAERAIWSDLRLPPNAEKPEHLPRVWSLTVATLHRAETAPAFHAAADAWIADVWAAWSAQHGLARQWLDHSIANLGRESSGKRHPR
ncbi:MAG TPA: DUF5946 family protein, partial [Gemmatimonadales bacterium]|nr:DUF5946 family protein [Gemmatimonadales bacterium]